MLSSHIACCTCGYDLVAHSASGQCPECGTPVMHSLGAPSLDFELLPVLRRLMAALLVGALSIGAVWGSLIFMASHGWPGAQLIATAAWILMFACGMAISHATTRGLHPRLQTQARWHGRVSMFMIALTAVVTAIQWFDVAQPAGGLVEVVWAVNAAGLFLWGIGLLGALLVLLRRMHSRLAVLAGWLLSLAAAGALFGLIALGLKLAPVGRDVPGIAAMPAGLCGLLIALGTPLLMLLSAWRLARHLPAAALAQQLPQDLPKAEHPAETGRVSDVPTEPKEIRR